MGWSWDSHTETAGTPIVEFAPPVENRRARLTSLVYTAAGTVHDLVIMRAIGECSLTDNDAAAATVIDVTTTSFVDQTLAANDWVIVEHGDGSWGLYKVSSVSSLDVTITPALTKDVVAGARVFIMGAPGDTAYHSTYKSVASTRQPFQDPAGIAESGYDTGTFSRDGLGDPLMLYSLNDTAAGTLNWGSGVHV